MGIQGFTSFIEDNTHLFTDCQLSNTRVVIDGNNLCYRLYLDNGLDVKHGGEYGQFTDLIKLFFKNLRACNVEPYVVYDGAYESNDHKFATTLDRSKRRIVLSETIARDGPGHLLPALASQTFKQVVSDLGVRCAQCDYEADREVVMLANHWNCPVISVDSDFFIFNIRAGYIPLNHLYWRSVCKRRDQDHKEDETGTQEKGPYLRAQVYTVDNFCSSFDGLQVEMLPLLSTLMGNDYVPVTLFQPFYSQIKLPKGNNVFFSRRYARAYGVISWLQERESLEDALQRVLSVFKKSERDDYKMIIQSSMAVYTFFKSYLLEYFSTGSLMCRLLTHDGYPLPEWVRQYIREGAMPTMCLNALANHRVFLYTQIEDLTQPSANTCSLPIRVAIYNILLSHDESKAFQESPKKSPRHTREFCVEEYDRMGKDLKRTYVRPVYESSRYGCLPNLAGLSALCGEDCRILLLEVLGVKLEDISELSPCRQFTIAVMCYWIQHANPKVSLLHLYSLLLTSLRQDILACQDTLPTGLLPEPATSSATSQQGKKGKQTWTPPKSWLPKTVSAFFDKFQKGSKSRAFDLEGVHGFAQYQSCMQYTIYLNKVLCLPFPLPDLAGLFSGTFAHELYKELKNKADVLGWIMLALGKTSQVAEEFYRLQTIVRQVVAEEYFAPRQQSRTARKKQKRRETSAASSSGYGEGSSSSSSSGEDDSREVETSADVVASCTLENKFAGLMSLDCDN